MHPCYSFGSQCGSTKRLNLTPTSDLPSHSDKVIPKVNPHTVSVKVGVRARVRVKVTFMVTVRGYL